MQVCDGNRWRWVCTGDRSMFHSRGSQALQLSCALALGCALVAAAPTLAAAQPVQISGEITHFLKGKMRIAPGGSHNMKEGKFVFPGATCQLTRDGAPARSATFRSEIRRPPSTKRPTRASKPA